ncbi:MAG: M28 family peptidase [Saprospiraceae bacterium]
MKKLLTFLIACIFLMACKGDKKPVVLAPVIKKEVKVPAFDSESAYAFIEKQLDFGPRVPGTPQHKACKAWIIATMQKMGTTVTIQDFKANFQNLKGIPSTNIIAQINPSHKKRILLAAHWDTRAISDSESNSDLKSIPVPGADDGGSGVAILMEIAKTIMKNPIDMGVDFLFFDAEDQGDSGDACIISCSWAQGAQYWSKNLIPKNYKPQYGILFDMVGAKNASFYKEGHSRAHAGPETDKIWTLANRMGYGDFFINQAHPQITDDHRFVNEIARIPMLDIINLKPNIPSQTFQKCWHSQCDDLNGINKRTLRVVGQVTTAVLYKESGNSL